MNEKKADSPWAKVVAKAWADEKFKQELLQNPEKVLQENGVTLPSGVKYKMVEDLPKEKHLILPSNDEDLHIYESLGNVVVGGYSSNCWTPFRS